MARRGGRGAAEVVVIWWRDIPAQVNAQVGREREQVLLPARFQRAIDRAKRKARIDTYEADIAQWRRESEPADGDLASAAASTAARLERDYPPERLGKLAFAGGYEVDVTAIAVSREELAALEELSDEEFAEHPLVVSSRDEPSSETTQEPS